MRVLPTIFPNAWNIAFYVSRVACGLIKRRRQEQDEPVRRANEILINRGHRSHSAARFRGAADNSPGLSDGIDAALLILSGAQRGAVIEVSAAIPLTVPAIAFECSLQQTYVNAPPFSPLAFSASVRHLRKL